MSQSKDRKNEMILSPSDAADLLHRLADQLEAGGVEIGQVVVENDGLVKIKQSVKTKSDKVSFKFKLRYETALTPELNGALGELPEEDPEDGGPAEEGQVETKKASDPQTAEAGEVVKADKEDQTTKNKKSDKDNAKDKKPSYKSIKNSMSKSYKSIKKALAEEVAPSVEEVGQFAAECQLMSSFSGKGDPNYEDFLHHVGDLQAAAEAGDVKALGRAMAEITAMRKSCHSEFK